jgi:hypothetical protein
MGPVDGSHRINQRVVESSTYEGATCDARILDLILILMATTTAGNERTFNLYSSTSRVHQNVTCGSQLVHPARCGQYIIYILCQCYHNNIF